jgi:hypothetical protein
VFPTSRVRRAEALICALAALAATGTARAATYVSGQTLKAGTKIACVLDEAVNSAQLRDGADFKLRVTDPSYPALEGAEIHGHVTEVDQPHSLERARIGFLLDYVQLRGGSKLPIRAYVVSRRVVPYNPASRSSSRVLPPMPHGVPTPGPIVWQMNLGGGKPSVGDQARGATGGYVYATNSNEPIVIRPGASVTIELASSLHVP